MAFINRLTPEEAKLAGNGIVSYTTDENGDPIYLDAQGNQVDPRGMAKATGALDEMVKMRSAKESRAAEQAYAQQKVIQEQKMRQAAQALQAQGKGWMVPFLGAMGTTQNALGQSAKASFFGKGGGANANEAIATSYGPGPLYTNAQKEKEAYERSLLEAQAKAIQDKSAREAAAYGQYMQSLDPMRQRAAGVGMISDLAGEAQRQKLLGDIATQAAMAQRGSYNPAIARAALMQQSGAGQQMAAQIAAQRAQEQAQAQQMYSQGLSQAAGLSQNAQQLAQQQYGTEGQLGLGYSQLALGHLNTEEEARKRHAQILMNREQIAAQERASKPNWLDVVGTIAGTAGGALGAIGTLGASGMFGGGGGGGGGQQHPTRMSSIGGPDKGFLGSL